jgi:hypothetical protein
MEVEEQGGSMKERPILFSASMVRALLEGRKTQTRRVVKPQPKPATVDCVSLDSAYPDKPWCWLAQWLDEAGKPLGLEESGKQHGGWPDCSDQFACPYGNPGDWLWVRETWRPRSWYPNSHVVQLRADMKSIDIDVPDASNGEAWIDRMLERCSDECIAAGIGADDDGNFQWDGEDNNPIKWRPSIFMPRWASRITLEITGVRVQRLQEISEGDCYAEGVSDSWPLDNLPYLSPFGGRAVKNNYAHLWESINGPASWAANPFVWAVSFKAVA